MQVNVKRARGTFLHLFTAQPGMANDDGSVGDPKFNGNFILDKDSEGAKAVRAAMEAVAIEKWGANGVKILDNLEASKKCLRDGNKALDKNGEVYAGYEDKAYIVASSKAKPGLFDNKKDPATNKARALTTDDGTIYSGCYLNLQLDVYVLDNPAKKIKGVFCELRGAQFADHGDRLGGNTPASADEFDVTDEPADDLGF
jgi:hypothetical protein